MIDCEDQPDSNSRNMEDHYLQNNPLPPSPVCFYPSSELKHSDPHPMIPENQPKPVPLYENVDLLNMPIVTNEMMGFPLGPPTNNMQPPKEKPPPPPIEDFDELALEDVSFI